MKTTKIFNIFPFGKRKGTICAINVRCNNVNIFEFLIWKTNNGN